MTTTNTLHEVRLSPGSRLRWRYCTPSGGLCPWHGTTVDVPDDRDGVIEAFARHGIDATAATIRIGRWVRCPRCNGTGYHGGGLCYRCYGESPVEFVEEV